MQVITPQLIKGKTVLLRLDLDVPLKSSKFKGQNSKLVVGDDFRLRAALPTLEMCLTYAKVTIIMGHIGRPNGREVNELSVAPVYDWLAEHLECEDLEDCQLKLLENLRFEIGEEACDLDYAKELASLGDLYINEAFAAYHPAASTTVLPKLLPSFAGLNFAREVRIIGEARDKPKKPLVAIIGGAKIEDKLPAALGLSKVADVVLLGGRLPAEVKEKGVELPGNVVVGRLNKEGTDLTPETVSSWENAIRHAQTIIWNGPLGRIEDLHNDQTRRLAEFILQSGAETVVGGGDTAGYLGKLGILGRFGFVSTGGGAMLKLLESGTLPTIEALE